MADLGGPVPSLAMTVKAGTDATVEIIPDKAAWIIPFTYFVPFASKDAGISGSGAGPVTVHTPETSPKMDIISGQIGRGPLEGVSASVAEKTILGGNLSGESGTEPPIGKKFFKIIDYPRRLTLFYAPQDFTQTSSSGSRPFEVPAFYLLGTFFKTIPGQMTDKAVSLKHPAPSPERPKIVTIIVVNGSGQIAPFPHKIIIAPPAAVCLRRTTAGMTGATDSHKLKGGKIYLPR